MGWWNYRVKPLSRLSSRTSVVSKFTSLDIKTSLRRVICWASFGPLLGDDFWFELFFRRAKMQLPRMSRILSSAIYFVRFSRLSAKRISGLLACRVFGKRPPGQCSRRKHFRLQFFFPNLSLTWLESGRYTLCPTSVCGYSLPSNTTTA